MSQNKGLNPEAARGKASELSGHLGTVDHLISELAATHRAALHPQSYGIDPGEKTIAPWSVGAVSGAQADLAAARNSAAELIQRIYQEVGSQVVASSNGISLASMFLTNTKDKATQDEIDDMIELANRAAEGYSMTDEQREQLAAYLAKFGKDENAMSQLFLSLGAENTSLLLFDLSTKVYLQAQEGSDDAERNAEMLQIAQALRDGLALASQDWTTAEANTFLGDAPFDSETTVAGLAYLFSDATNPLGVNLTVELAERIDDWERVQDDNPTFAELGFVPESPLYKLSLAEEGAHTGGSDRDLAGRVFETLGQYPDQALEFLAPLGDDALGADRVAYWYGDRDWSDLDQWEGPGALWLGATSSVNDAGPYEGVDGVPEARNALLTSQIIFELAQNESFLTNGQPIVGQNISELGASYFAGALAINLADISESAIQNGFRSEDEAGVRVMLGFGDEANSAFPRVDGDDLAKVLAQIIGYDGTGETGNFEHPDAAQIIYNTATDMQAMYYLAGQGDHSLLGDAASRSMYLQGLLDGTSMGGSEALAERHDQQSDAAIDSVMDVVKTVPFGSLITKGIEKGLGVVIGEAVNLDWVSKKLISTGVSEGTSSLVDMWKESQHDSSSVANLMAGREDALATQANLQLAHLLYDAVGDTAVEADGHAVPSVPEPRTKESADAFADRVADWWERYGKPLGDAAGYSAELQGGVYQDSVDANRARSH